jgi:hypothetical protein
LGVILLAAIYKVPITPHNPPGKMAGLKFPLPQYFSWTKVDSIRVLVYIHLDGEMAWWQLAVFAGGGGSR